MTEPTDDPRIAQRAELYPEEQSVEPAVAADTASEQARLILEESDYRTDHPEDNADGSELDPEATSAGE